MNGVNFKRETGPDRGIQSESALIAHGPLWLLGLFTSRRAGWQQWRAQCREKRQQRRRRRLEKKQQSRRRAQRLQPKLTRSYLWVTVLAVLAIELCIGLLAAALAFRPALSPAQAAVEAERLAARLLPLSVSLRPQNAAVIQKTLKKQPAQRMTFVVTDASLIVLTSVPEGVVRIGAALPSQPLQGELLSQDVAALAKAVALQRAASQKDLTGAVARRTRDGGSLSVAPVRRANRVMGLVWMHSAPPPDAGNFFQAMLGTIVFCTIVVGVFASVVGAGFGWFTARRLTRRLEAIEAASAAWGQGQFGVMAVDAADDEIGQLARRLNTMAQELQELVALRQNLAMAEERNRLARELHDTVKQQVFATIMQIGAAKSLLDGNGDNERGATHARLEAAEQLAQSAQSELTVILEQLRPGSYQSPLQSTRDAQGAAISPRNELLFSHNWLQIVEQFARQWSAQSGIELHFTRDCEAPLLPATQGQSLCRLVQEALSNIARHSGATIAQLRLTRQAVTVPHQSTFEPVSFELKIADNGCGFDWQNAPRGLGLQSMRERAESLPCGRFEIESRVGQGTELRVLWHDDSLR
ncbi:MAG: hypothetical protein JWN98_251 [Abditibacteriota bacterium]|nr:hypothetical protein [Abditibacteriota bacterium]